MFTSSATSRDVLCVSASIIALNWLSKFLEPMLNSTFADSPLAKCLADISGNFCYFTSHFELIENEVLDVMVDRNSAEPIDFNTAGVGQEGRSSTSLTAAVMVAEHSCKSCEKAATGPTHRGGIATVMVTVKGNEFV
ncbi:hypothetical protein CEXT_187641 [Caerostris extrusa]|uniref:Uncharacterized protein n=1 Tax=Caerostris extrusa TaxID=172846 RepID=A0AAV4WYB6_CAEEX|nr:hypothetical protein CEXT_187641 [Caerostris extrusa]